jgi:hypothetical protein
VLFCGQRFSSSHADVGDQGGAMSICSLTEFCIFEVSFHALWYVFIFGNYVVHPPSVVLYVLIILI